MSTDKQAEERRCFAPVEELRVVESDGKPTRIEGLAAPYGRLSEDLGGFRERIVPGAFDESVRGKRELRVDVEHDYTRLLARRSKGTADFTTKPDGVWVSFRLPDTSRGRDTLEDVRNGNLDGLSASWLRSTTKSRWIEEGGETIREITFGELTGATLTFSPAYTQTVDTLVMRSLEQHQAEQAEEDPDEAAKLRMRLDLAQAECE